jgi:hypothetical protein
MEIEGVEWEAQSGTVSMWTGRVGLLSFASCQTRYYLLCTFPGPVVVGRQIPDDCYAPPGQPVWVPLEVDTPRGEPSPAQAAALRRLLSDEPRHSGRSWRECLSCCSTAT